MIPLKGRFDSGVSSATAYKSMPRQGSTGAPSMAELRNPSLTNTQISFQSNVTSSVPLMIRPWLDNYERNFAPGSILFVHINEYASRLNTVADLPLMNFILEKAHYDVRGGADIDEIFKRGIRGESPAESIVTNIDTGFEKKGWNQMGILRNDMLADSQLQKLLNVDVFGRSMVGNIWGKLCRNDHVGLAMVEVARKDGKIEGLSGFVQPDGNYITSAVINSGVELYQILPTINDKIPKDLLSMAKTEGNDADGNPIVRPILRYPLGVVSHAVARVPSLGQRRMALRSQSHFTLLPRIEILMI